MDLEVTRVFNSHAFESTQKYISDNGF